MNMKLYSFPCINSLNRLLTKRVSHTDRHSHRLTVTHFSKTYFLESMIPNSCKSTKNRESKLFDAFNTLFLQR